MARIMLILAAAVALSATTASAANNQGGSSGFGFSCDAVKRTCKCTGPWEGADCQAMDKNCDHTGPIRQACDASGQNTYCTCGMAKTGGKTLKIPAASPRPAQQLN